MQSKPLEYPGVRYDLGHAFVGDKTTRCIVDLHWDVFCAAGNPAILVDYQVSTKRSANKSQILVQNLLIGRNALFLSEVVAVT